MTLGDAGFVPERLGNAERIDADCLPPSLFVADAVDFAVMHPAEWDRELIARFAAERARLRIAQMMGIRRLTAADQASLPGDVAQVILVAVAPWLGNREGALFRGLLLRGCLS